MIIRPYIFLFYTHHVQYVIVFIVHVLPVLYYAIVADEAGVVLSMNKGILCDSMTEDGRSLR